MRACAVVLVACAIMIGPAYAQDGDRSAQSASVWSRVGLSGSVRLGYWSSSRDLDTDVHRPVATLWLKAAPEDWHGLGVVFEGWTQAREGAGSVKGSIGVRDAFVAGRWGPLDLRVGRQVIPWGRADGINPTDNLTPRDFTVLVPDDSDERLGAAAVKATVHGRGLSLTGVWLPEFLPHAVPLPLPSATAVHVNAADRAHRRWGIRLDRTGGSIDWAVSWFEGPDLFPDLGVSDVFPVTLTHPRVRIVGGDAVAVVGRFVLRVEAAYSSTPDPDGTNPFVRNPFALVVAGGERTFGEYFNVNVQYIGRYVRHHRPSPAGLDDHRRLIARQHAVLTSQTSATQHGVTARLAHRWRRETVEAELAGVAFFDPTGHAVRPKISWAVTDRWKLTAGGDWFNGAEDSFYRLLRSNAALFAEVRWSY